MATKTYVIDVDGVLANFIFGFRSLANEMYGVPVYGSEDARQFSWDIPDLTAEQKGRVWSVLKKNPLWWFELPMLATEEEVSLLRKIHSGHTVYFVTARVGLNPKWQTEQWIKKKLGIETPSVIVSKWKGEIARAVEAHASIDDKAENAWAIAWITRGETKSYLIDRAYNQSPIGSSKVQRVKTLLEFLQEVQ